MALVVLLRGVNVGGHRTFRPAKLAAQLKQFDVVNIGAAGTFVVRKPVSQAKLRAELARLLPFETETAIVQGRDVLALTARDPFARHTSSPDVVCFVSVLVARARIEPAYPFTLPVEGKWLLRIIARDGPFVIGQYRREMKAISHLGTIDKLFGRPVTTRNWNTVTAIAKVLGD